MFNNKLKKIIILIIGIIVFSHFLNYKRNIINELIYIKNVKKFDFNKSEKENSNNFNLNSSIIIPVYNCEKTINESILSIQKQNLTNLEIILVNDFSTDNSINIIQIIMKNDTRIKLINNKRNYGTLYSRSIGALSAKGSYIFSLDNDDEFYGNDSLDFIYNQAIEGNYDIVTFKRIYSRRPKVPEVNSINNNNFRVIHQPELSIFPIAKQGKFFPNSFFIWDKCIKTSIYKHAVHLLGNEIYHQKISYNEDIIIVFIIFSISKSMKIINKYGIIHYIYNSSTSRTRKQTYKSQCNIYLLDILFRFSRNSHNKNLCVEYFMRNKNYLKRYSTKKNIEKLIHILELMISDKFITDKNKQYLKQFIKNMNNERQNKYIL